MNNTKYDVTIVGAGPAGSTAGYLLSKSGIKVLIIDKHRLPRKKLCGGLITHKTVKLLERVFGESVISLKEKDIINFESSRYEIFCKNTLITQRNINIPFRFISRYHYDHFLLAKAQQAGADLVEGDGIASLDVLKNMLTTLSGRVFKTDIIIGADGVNSTIRRNFPVALFGREDWTQNLAAAHEIIADRASVKKQINHPIIYFDFIDWGYTWIFPNRERLKIGICALKRKNTKDILTVFRNFLSSIDLLNTKDEKILSYVVPFGSFLPSPIFRNILLIGDAAGFADPLLGEGIYYAQRSAELAAQAICVTLKKGMSLDSARDKAGEYYTKLLQQDIYPELVYAEKIRDTIFTYLNRFQYFPLKLIMSVLGNRPVETVHGIRSYKWMSRMRESMNTVC